MATWYEEARQELTSAKRSATAYRTEAARQKQRADSLERQLTGALYRLYGSWAKVNKELGRG